MATLELNRDVKRLVKRYKMYQSAEFNETESIEIYEELKRLYNADKEMKSLTKNNIRLMLRLNLSLRAIPLHQFGLSIDL